MFNMCLSCGGSGFVFVLGLVSNPVGFDLIWTKVSIYVVGCVCFDVFWVCIMVGLPFCVLNAWGFRSLVGLFGRAMFGCCFGVHFVCGGFDLI